MAQRLSQRGTRSPRPRVPEEPGQDGYFFPGEVAELLGCRDIDYHQLRRLFRLVRIQAAVPVRERKWARFTLRDIAALRIALNLCGGVAALDEGRHLRIAPLERACAALRDQGVVNPLLDVPMRREGIIVFAEIDGQLFNPVNGQMRLDEARDMVTEYLAGLEFKVPTLERRRMVRALRSEAKHPVQRAAPTARGGVEIR